MDQKQHIGDLAVTEDHEQHGQVTGTTYVRAGGHLVCHGQLAGGLIIEEGGAAVVHGQVCRNIVNHGDLILLGQCVGRLVGKPPKNPLQPNQVVGDDLEVPFSESSHAFSFDG